MHTFWNGRENEPLNNLCTSHSHLRCHQAIEMTHSSCKLHIVKRVYNVCRYWPGSGDTESAGCTSRLCLTHQGQWGCGNGRVCKFTMHGDTWCICAMSYMLISTCLQYEIWTDFHTVSNEHARPGNKASISQSHTHADGWLLAFCLVGRSCIRLSVIEDQNTV